MRDSCSRCPLSSPPPCPPGQQFGGQIIPSATVLVVGVGRAEAKVEGLFSEVCRLNYKGNVFDSMGGEVLKGAHARENWEGGSYSGDDDGWIKK